MYKIKAKYNGFTGYLVKFKSSYVFATKEDMYGWRPYKAGLKSIFDDSYSCLFVVLSNVEILDNNKFSIGSIKE